MNKFHSDAHDSSYILVGFALIILMDTFYANAAMNSPLDPREVRTLCDVEQHSLNALNRHILCFIY